MELWTVGLNHRTAPVEVRERLAPDSVHVHSVLRRLYKEDLIKEGVLLSTCNRVELYSHGGPSATDPTDPFRRYCEMIDVPFDEVDPHLYEHNHLRAVQHCFEVAGSLNSMVVGEPQILGQVKEAYDIAREGGYCGKYLHQMFQESFRVAKQIRSRTRINEFPASVGSAAVTLADQIYGDLASKSVLLVGGGEMSELCLRHLRSEGVTSTAVVNRTEQRARELADEFGGRAGSLSRLDEFLVDADIVITSTGSSDPVVQRDELTDTLRSRGSSPLFIIDIAVPRDVDPAVASMENVYLYDIDNLESVVRQNMSRRQEESDRAHEIVLDAVDQFEEWLKTQDVSPLIRELKQEVYQLVESELREQINEDGRSVNRADLQLAAHRITNKLLDEPLNVLKEKAIEGKTESISMVSEMFDLEQTLDRGA